MIRVDIKIDDNIGKALTNMRKELANYPKDAAGKFISLTPVKTGNARRNTRLKNSQTIEANYPYAQRLDEGYSNQAPQGMSKPFEQWVKQKMKKIFGK
jgi:hypothetical protein